MLVVPQKKLGRIDASNSKTLEVRKTSPNVIVSVMVPLSLATSILQAMGKMETETRLSFVNPLSMIQNCSGFPGSSYVAPFSRPRSMARCISIPHPAYGTSGPRGVYFLLAMHENDRNHDVG